MATIRFSSPGGNRNAPYLEVCRRRKRQEIQQDCSARGHDVRDGDGRPQGGTRTRVDATEEDGGLQQVDQLPAAPSSSATAAPSSPSPASSRGWRRSRRRDAYRRDGEEHGAPVVASHQEPSRRAHDERLDDDRRRRQRPRRGTAAHADTHVEERHLQRAAALVGRLLQTLLQAPRETSGKNKWKREILVSSIREDGCILEIILQDVICFFYSICID